MLELVEQAGLENRYAFTGIEGSNPSLSAKSLSFTFVDDGLLL